MSAELPEYFTIVFDGRLRDLTANPFKIDSPFGQVVAVGIGDALGRQESLIELINLAEKAQAIVDHCVDGSTNELEIDGFEGNLSDFSVDLSCAINRAQGG